MAENVCVANGRIGCGNGRISDGIHLELTKRKEKRKKKGRGKWLAGEFNVRQGAVHILVTGVTPPCRV